MSAKIRSCLVAARVSRFLSRFWPRVRLVGRAEIGAAWTKKSNEGREYLGLKLDDPSFATPIYANLFDDEDGEGSSLIWSRPNTRRGD